MSFEPIEVVYTCMQIIGPSLDNHRLVWGRLACLPCLIHNDQHDLPFFFLEKLLPNEE